MIFLSLLTTTARDDRIGFPRPKAHIDHFTEQFIGWQRSEKWLILNKQSGHSVEFCKIKLRCGFIFSLQRSFRALCHVRGSGLWNTFLSVPTLRSGGQKYKYQKVSRGDEEKSWKMFELLTFCLETVVSFIWHFSVKHLNLEQMFILKHCNYKVCL